MIKFRKALLDDLLLYYNWANDKVVRSQSFNSNIIELSHHEVWFKNAINNPNIMMLVFINEKNENVGQVRIQKNLDTNEAIIAVSIAEEFRGKGYASEILLQASNHFFDSNQHLTINAYIKRSNLESIKSFIKAGFVFEKNIIYQECPSFLYIKNIK